MTGRWWHEPVVHFEDDFWFPLSPSRLWDTIEHFDHYTTWWRWLRDFTTVPQDCGLVDGAELLGTVVPPVPYRLSLRVTLDRCLPPASVEASVDGDLRGDALLRLTPVGDGTTATVTWTLRFVSPPLRLAAQLAFPLMQWGHDQVVAMAVTAFRRNALAIVDA